MKAFGFCSFKTDSRVAQASLELLMALLPHPEH